MKQPQTGFKKGRLNVLLTQDRPHAPGHWTIQLPRLLAPQGVMAHVAHSGEEAIRMAARIEFHAAVIDLSIPRSGANSEATDEQDNEPISPEVKAAVRAAGGPDVPAGLWLLEFFRRLPNRPPVVVVHSPAFSRREVDRLLRDAIRLDVFTVLPKPVELENLLHVFRRLLDRQYRGVWPGPADTNPEQN